MAAVASNFEIIQEQHKRLVEEQQLSEGEGPITVLEFENRRRFRIWRERQQEHLLTTYAGPKSKPSVLRAVWRDVVHGEKLGLLHLARLVTVASKHRE